MCIRKEYGLNNEYNKSLKLAPTHALQGEVGSICLISSFLRSNYCHCEEVTGVTDVAIQPIITQCEKVNNKPDCFALIRLAMTTDGRCYIQFPSPSGRGLGRGDNLCNLQRNLPLSLKRGQGEVSTLEDRRCVWYP